MSSIEDEFASLFLPDLEILSNINQRNYQQQEHQHNQQTPHQQYRQQQSTTSPISVESNSNNSTNTNNGGNYYHNQPDSFLSGHSHYQSYIPLEASLSTGSNSNANQNKNDNNGANYFNGVIQNAGNNDTANNNFNNAAFMSSDNATLPLYPYAQYNEERQNRHQPHNHHHQHHYHQVQQAQQLQQQPFGTYLEHNFTNNNFAGLSNMDLLGNTPNDHNNVNNDTEKSLSIDMNASISNNDNNNSFNHFVGKTNMSSPTSIVNQFTSSSSLPLKFPSLYQETEVMNGSASRDQQILSPREIENQQKMSKKAAKTNCSSEYAYLLDLIVKEDENSFRLLDENGDKTTLDLKGEMDGRFLYSDTQKEQKIKNLSCYRRNFMQLSVNLSFTKLPIFSIIKDYKKSKIKRFKLSVYGTTKFSDDKIDLLIFNDNSDSMSSDSQNSNNKKSSNHKDIPSNVHYLNSLTQEISLSSLDISEFHNFKFILKKVQFKNATPNNGKSTVFQNYYHIIISLSFIVEKGDNEEAEVHIANLKSHPIQVRGRNPSFYSGRNDVLIVKDPSKKKIYPDDIEQQNKIAGSTSTFPLTNNDGNINGLLSIGRSPSSLDPMNSIPFLRLPNISHALPAIEENEQNAINSSSSNTSSNNNSGKPVEAKESESPSNYQYFPLSNVYYLPPLDALYFPHVAHHPRQSSIVRNRRKSMNESNTLVDSKSSSGGPGMMKQGIGGYTKIGIRNILNSSDKHSEND